MKKTILLPAILLSLHFGTADAAAKSSRSRVVKNTPNAKAKATKGIRSNRRAKAPTTTLLTPVAAANRAAQLKSDTAKMVAQQKFDKAAVRAKVGGLTSRVLLQAEITSFFGTIGNRKATEQEKAQARETIKQAKGFTSKQLQWAETSVGI